MHRFYLPPNEWQADALFLHGGEAHHARTVLRLLPADRVTIFDGEGREAAVEIVRVDAERLQLRLLTESTTPWLRCRITLAQAIPKGKNMELIVQKAVELGAAEIVPLLSDRTVVRLAGKEAAQKQEKWQSIAIEAAKQCGQNWLPRVARPRTSKEYFAGLTHDEFDLRLIGSLQPDAEHLKKILADFAAADDGERPRRVLILVGPEGDFSPDEIALARANGCTPLTLGPIILRVETAAIYCLSILSYELL